MNRSNTHAAMDDRDARAMRRAAAPVVMLAACWAAFAAPAISLGAAPQGNRPNIIFVLADDLGWTDLSCYGSRLNRTPALDRLASQGMRFTQAYTAGAVCSPTRGSIQTGKYPVRTGVTDYIPGLNPTDMPLLCQPTRRELALEEVTIGEALRRAGYQTFYSGKWHLGGESYGPQQQGYEVAVNEKSLGSTGNDPLVGDRLTDSALKFLEARDASRPFFMFLGYNEPHTPIIPHPKHIERFNAAAAKLPKVEPATRPERNGITRLVQDDPAYASEVAVLDEAVQRIDERLAALKLTDDTIVIFTSDNGGLSTRSKPGTTSNVPLRAGKGWLYEGGIRVPLVIRGPGIVKPGETCDAPIVSTDYFPTLLELAGAPLEPQHHQDGRSFLPALRKENLPARPMFWHYAHYHGSTWAPGSAIRDGDWKLIEFFDPPAVELYNVREDIGEQHDLAATEPQKAAELRTKLTTWRKETGALMPKENTAAGDGTKKNPKAKKVSK